ncbi:MAG: MBL fold metallo-hydrolase [Defluviitaleaceae bacterium]|nr:MBL fold metallo-hydrolase [Defluviitaleaceae bacterium]
MPKILFQGHGSFRLTADDGRVVYVDPFKGGGYDLPASVILVTHRHNDHDRIKRCAQKKGCRVITDAEALAGGKHNVFEEDGILIQAVEASNKLHDPKKCVGYIITIDGKKIYASGDTSTTGQMKTFSDLNLDCALFPGDGFFNMGPAEAAECARMVGAKKNILIHLKPGESYRKKGEKWDAPNKMILEPGNEAEI